MADKSNTRYKNYEATLAGGSTTIYDVYTDLLQNCGKVLKFTNGSQALKFSIDGGDDISLAVNEVFSLAYDELSIRTITVKNTLYGAIGAPVKIFVSGAPKGD